MRWSLPAVGLHALACGVGVIVGVTRGLVRDVITAANNITTERAAAAAAGNANESKEIKENNIKIALSSPKMAAEKTASATDLAAAPVTTASVLSQLALASYLYQNGLLEANVNDRNEKALGATNPKLSAFNAIAARDALVAMLLAARGGITATNDDLRVAAGRHAPVGDMHMETVRPLQTRGALADPRVDSKEFAVGALEFRADTLAIPALTTTTTTATTTTTTTTTDLDFYRSADPMANAAAITGHPVIARVVSSTPLIEEGAQPAVTQVVSHAAVTTHRTTTLRGKRTPEILSVLTHSLTCELGLFNNMVRAQMDLPVSARIEYFDRLTSIHAVTATETRPLIGNPVPTIHDLSHRQSHILTAKTPTCRTVVACAAYFTMPEPLIGTILACQKQLHFYATDDAVKNMTGKRTAAAGILDSLRSTLPHLTAAPVLNYYHANSTVAGPRPHDKTLIMVEDRHFASALENARRPIGIDAVPAAHLQLEEHLSQHSSSTAPHLVAASATATVRTVTLQLPMNAVSAPHNTLLPIRTHADPTALFSATPQASRTTHIPARRRSGPTVRRTLEPVLAEEEEEEDEESPAMPAPITAPRRVTERPAGPRVAFTLANDSRGRARSALPAVAAVTEEVEESAVLQAHNERNARPTTVPTHKELMKPHPDAPLARGLTGPRARLGTRHAPEPPRPAAVPHFSHSRPSRAPIAALVEEVADEEKELIPHTRTATATSLEQDSNLTRRVQVSRTPSGSPLSRVKAMHRVAECEEEEEDEEMKVVHSAGLTLPLTQNSMVATSLALLPSPTTPKFVFKPLPGTMKQYRLVKEARVAKLPPMVAPTAILPHPTVLAKLVEVVDESLPLHVVVGVMPPHPITPTVTSKEPTPTSATTTSTKPLPAVRGPFSRRDGLPASRSLGGRRAAAPSRKSFAIAEEDEEEGDQLAVMVRVSAPAATAPRLEPSALPTVAATTISYSAVVPVSADQMWKPSRLSQPSVIPTKGADLDFADMDAWIASLTERADFARPLFLSTFDFAAWFLFLMARLAFCTCVSMDW
ncbi:hypothetical protein GGF32_005212 [Allomyces javanicus]|nr:hypothetical protein GGF32_005212 [Allomyces javanicus]